MAKNEMTRRVIWRKWGMDEKKLNKGEKMGLVVRGGRVRKTILKVNKY